MSDENRKPNRLVHEQSPYLLQHAHNPVDWFPWGQEAVDKARRENKPILVSIGYSTCHWCHVMEHESFSDTVTADIMNKRFVCIKVDREERPDIDKIFITAVSALTGSAGWPLNVFITPEELKPFYGGSYFPPDKRHGMMSWTDMLLSISDAWANDDQRQKILSSASALAGVVEKITAGNIKAEKGAETFTAALLDSAYDVFASHYDKNLGGFSGAPKFPMPPILSFMTFYSDYNQKNKTGSHPGENAFKMVEHTLEAMSKGGIYDQIGGGFHRYSTDANWHVPHFEKMLYDNAQLIVTYAEAYRKTKNSLFLDIAENTADYVLRDMTRPDGAFYSAEDADSIDPGGTGEKKEGAYYVWSKENIETILGDNDSEIFCYVYGVRPRGNALFDPSGEFIGMNILYRDHSVEETAEKFGRTAQEIRGVLDRAKEILFRERSKRTRPGLDDKIITSWNGLMISALSRLYTAGGKRKYISAAQKAAVFLKGNLYDPASNTLSRIWRKQKSEISGLSEDYAFLTQGLIDLYEADSSVKWLEWAERLADQFRELFIDKHTARVFMTPEGFDPNMFTRPREDTDSVIPSAASVTVLNLIRLSGMAGRSDFSKTARKIIESSPVSGSPASAPMMLTALGSLPDNR